MNSDNPNISSSEQTPHEKPQSKTLLLVTWAIAGGLIVAIGLGGAGWKFCVNAYGAYRPGVKLSELLDDTFQKIMDKSAEETASAMYLEDKETRHKLLVEANTRMGERLTQHFNDLLREERKRRMNGLYTSAILLGLAVGATLGWIFIGIRYGICRHIFTAFSPRPTLRDRVSAYDEILSTDEPDSTNVIADLIKKRQ